jgi:flagellar hook-associated protein 1
MSLSAALNAARSSLSANATQTSLLSRNIAGANEPLYTRKHANVSSFEGGGVRIDSIGRAADPALMTANLGATSQTGKQQAIVEGLEKLEQTVGDPESDRSPAALIGALRDAMQLHAASPESPTTARAVLAGAKDVAEALRSGSAIAQATRQAADAGMAESVGKINGLLSRLEPLNAEIVRGTSTGADVTDKLDSRDKILTGLSEEMGIRIVKRADNDIALYTDGGVTLFETTARSVRMQPTQSFGAATVGNAILVDGVPVVGGSTSMPLQTGRLAGLAAVRDTVAVTYQAQLDETARGLVEAFAESDRNNPATLPTIPGLFTYSGAPAMPASGTLVPGLAAGLSVSANVDPDRGGSLSRLRDGGIGNPAQPAYVANPSGAASYSGRLQEMTDALGAARAFDPAAGADQSAGVIGFAASSVGWLEASRQRASAELDYRQTLVARSSEALSNATGVNIDEEMSKMLELERSYQASAKIIATVDGLFAALLQAA